MRKSIKIHKRVSLNFHYCIKNLSSTHFILIAFIADSTVASLFQYHSVFKHHLRLPLKNLETLRIESINIGFNWIYPTKTLIIGIRSDYQKSCKTDNIIEYIDALDEKIEINLISNNSSSLSKSDFEEIFNAVILKRFNPKQLEITFHSNDTDIMNLLCA